MPPSGRARGRPRGQRPARGTSSRRGERSQTAASETTEDSPADQQAADVIDAHGHNKTSDGGPVNPSNNPVIAAVNVEATPDSPALTAASPAVSSLAPAASSIRGQSSTVRGSAVMRARAGASGSSTKFKPRAIRRGDAERERIAQEEIRKQNIKVAEDQRLQRAKMGRGGGRGGRARGRGDAMGRGSGFGRKTASDSVFLGNPGAVHSGFGRAKSEFKASTYRDASNRLNADMFNGPMDVYFDDEDEDQKMAPSAGANSSTPTTAGPKLSSSRKRDIMPMGIPRRELKKSQAAITSATEMGAKEKTAAVTARRGSEARREASSDTTSTDAATQQGEEDGGIMAMEDDGKVWPGAPANRKVKIKAENGEEIEVTQIDDHRLAAAAASMKTEEGRGRATGERPTTKFATREEEIAAEKLELMLSEFGPRTAEADSRDGRMYLFQFPPVLPPLRVVSKPRPKSDEKKITVKDEPVDDTVVATGVGETFDLTTAASPTAASTAGGDGVEGLDEGKDSDDDSARPYPDTVGYVGRMVVRRSGKTTIDWGGIPFQVMPGIQTSFLTNAVLLEESDVKGVKPGEISGKAYGMGKIMGRFVCRPIWSETEPWIVKPEDLVVEGSDGSGKGGEG